jgi:hypothetical protein
MSKPTLFEIVAEIISDLNDDEITSIADTIESLQVATMAKSVYYEVIDGRNWPHLTKLGQLEPSGDTSKPTHMRVPVDYTEIGWVEYDVRDTVEDDIEYKKIGYKTPDEFLRLTSSYKSTNANVSSVVDHSGATLLIKTDEAPTYWTSFDDSNIVFNAYDSEIDDTLQNDKSRIYGDTRPTFELVDEYVPILPADMFSAYIAEVKSTAFQHIKQTVSQKTEQQARRGKARMSRKAFKTASGMKPPRRGRRSRK